MTDTSHLAELTAIRTDLLQDELPEVISRVPYHWRSSWWERVLMIVIPVVVFAVYWNTTGYRPSKYSTMFDGQFYLSRYPGGVCIQVARWPMEQCYLLGLLLSTPSPLMRYEDLIRQTKQRDANVFGLVTFHDELCYPESLMTIAGCSKLEIVVYKSLVAVILIGWILLEITNIIRFARYRRWLRNYKLYG